MKLKVFALAIILITIAVSAYLLPSSDGTPTSTDSTSSKSITKSFNKSNVVTPEQETRIITAKKLLEKFQSNPALSEEELLDFSEELERNFLLALDSAIYGQKEFFDLLSSYCSMGSLYESLSEFSQSRVTKHCESVAAETIKDYPLNARTYLIYSDAILHNPDASYEDGIAPIADCLRKIPQNKYCRMRYDHFISDFSIPTCKSISKDFAIFLGDRRSSENFLVPSSYSGLTYYTEDNPRLDSTLFTSAKTKVQKNLYGESQAINFKLSSKGSTILEELSIDHRGKYLVMMAGPRNILSIQISTKLGGGNGLQVSLPLAESFDQTIFKQVCESVHVPELPENLKL